MRQRNESIFVEVMARHMFSAKPLPEPMMTTKFSLERMISHAEHEHVPPPLQRDKILSLLQKKMSISLVYLVLA